MKNVILQSPYFEWKTDPRKKNEHITKQIIHSFYRTLEYNFLVKENGGLQPISQVKTYTRCEEPTSNVASPLARKVCG